MTDHRKRDPKCRILPVEVWQPIETAPKSSRAILVYCPENLCTYAVTWGLTESEAHGGKEFYTWRIFGGGYRDCIQRPTHWQHLPKPPQGD